MYNTCYNLCFCLTENVKGIFQVNIILFRISVFFPKIVDEFHPQKKEDYQKN